MSRSRSVKRDAPPPDLRQQTEFTGHVRRTTFESEDGAFRVATFQLEDGREFKVAGDFAGAAPGEILAIRGEWREHSRYGWTFRIASYQPILPTTRAAMLAYLGSGLIKGVGPSKAARLVEHFGDRTFQVLEESPELLSEVPGFGRRLARQIADQWDRHRQDREAMVFFKEHGLTNALAIRLLKFYGDRAVAIMRRNPYQAGLDVPRIGFLRADEIANRLGIARDAPIRLRAALVHVLDAAANDGHTHLTEDRLLDEAEKLLAVPRDAVAAQLDAAIAENIVRREPVDGSAEGYFMPSLFLAERGVARRIAELQAQARPLPVERIDDRLDAFERRHRFTLAAQQRTAIRNVAGGGICVITGGPGTGKTTLVRALLDVLKGASLTVRLASPTGRAAQRLAETTRQDAATVHRLLKWNAQNGAFTHNADNRLEANLVIVDESSMLDIPLAHSLLEALCPGTTVVFVGDVDQLPSVGPGMFLRDLIASGRATTTRLEVVFRQAEQSLIVQNAHRINEGRSLVKGDADKADFFFVERDDPEQIREAMLAMATERIPRRLGCDAVEGVQVLTPMRRGPLGANDLNTLLRERLNPNAAPAGPGLLRLGDKVMQTSNNYDLDVYNGDVGRIEGIHHETRQVRVRFGRRTVHYAPEMLDELDPAYAITIHKSQGSEYPAVIVLLHTSHYVMLRRNLVYTAVTRGKKLVVLIGSRRALFRAIRTAGDSERLTALASWLTRPPKDGDLFG